MKGTARMKQWELDRIQERDAIVLTTRCQCGWTHEGPLGEGRDLYTAHRLEHHPEIQPPYRRKRHRIQGQLGQRTLDENIALVREQGGASWEGANA